MRRAFKLFVAVSLIGIVADPVFAQAPAAPLPPVKVEGHFEKFNEQKALGFVLVNGKPQSFIVQGADKDILIERLKTFQKGDFLVLELEKAMGNPDVLKSVSIKTVPVSRWTRLLVFGFSIGFFWLLIFLLVWSNKFPKIITGEDGRYSNSKFQASIWFGLVFGSYVAMIYLRLESCHNCFIAGIDIPDHLLQLSMFSAGTLGAAKAITSAKEGADRAKGLAIGEKPNLIKNLTTNDKGNPDLGDIQMLVILLLAVGIYMLEVFKSLGTIPCAQTTSLPELDSTLLALFGLGQGAYLAKKLGGRPGDS